ncbi:MAG TPA: methyltransferase [Gammaproteobacteria bacterium]|nr:methyltransferase [Gammaproteobacteria bacterium]
MLRNARYSPAIAVLLASLAAPIGASTEGQGSTPVAVDQAFRDAIAGSHRSSKHAARDEYRHPRRTLEFFGMRPDMRVEEFLPEGGWYTEILAPFLHDDGKLVEATFSTNSDNEFIRRMAQDYRAKLQGNEKVYGRVSIRPIEPPAYVPLGPPGSLDMIVSFRNLHDLVYVNAHDEAWGAGVRKFFHSAYRALEPGGVLGIVAHRANPGTDVGKASGMGRLPQAYVERQARRAGFRLAAASDVNANPRDDRTRPVWYFPPTLKAPEEQRAEYRSKGEADNMTLRFVKPGGTGGDAG